MRNCTKCDRILEIEPAIEGVRGLLCFPCRYGLDLEGGEQFLINLAQYRQDYSAWEKRYGARHAIHSNLVRVAGFLFVLSICLLGGVMLFEVSGALNLVFVGVGVSVLLGIMSNFFSCPDQPRKPKPDIQALDGQPVLVFTSNTVADGKISTLNIPNDYPPDWDQRRAHCLRRDGNACRLCPSTESPLHAHHVKPVSFGGNHSLQNLITLCAACHIKQTNYIGTTNLHTSTSEQPP